MSRTRAVENRQDRRELATEAGFPRVSFVSILAGVLVGYGAFAILAAIAGGVLNLLGVETESLSSNDWRQLGIATGIAAALTLFLSYLFGGYVAGRMARRSGAFNGLFVFVLSILLAAGVGAAVGTQADGDAIMNNLESIGVPTSRDDWMAIGTFAGIGSLVAMFLGSVLGGIMGERWHGKLLTRALDPMYGPTDGEGRDRLRDRDRDRDREGAEAVEVRSAGRHFRSDRDTVDRDADTVDVTDTDTTLDDDLAPEHSRTLH